MPPAKGVPADSSINPGGPTQFGRYQLIKKLAAGGMAEVFLARQQGMEGFEKLVVLKRILPHLAGDEEFVQMFLNEARIAARFNHANIVQIYDLGKAEGTYFIGMEYIHGEDLGRIMRKAWNDGRWLPMQLSMAIIARACEGLYYAHTKTDESGTPLQVVHRDISPQNILVSFDGGVKIVDFGIARAADSATMTKSGTIKGKYAYMSPEQAEGKPIDGRTDVFALGLVLYELLTGVRPLKRDSDIATLQAALTCDIDPPSKVASISETLDPVVMKALAPKVGARYQNAREFQLAIEDYLIQNQLAASSVHLSEFMKELFADRLEEEARLGRPAPAGPGTASGQSMPRLKAYTQGEVEEVSESQLMPNTGSFGQVTAPVAVPEFDDQGRPKPRRTSTGAGTPQARRPSRADVPAAAPAIGSDDDDDEPTSLDGESKPAAPRRTSTGSRKAAQAPAEAPRRRTGELPSARGAERSRARVSGPGNMPDAPPRHSSTNVPRSDAWKEGSKSKGRQGEGQRRSSLVPALLVGVAVAAGGFLFKDQLLALAGGQGGGKGHVVATDNSPSLSIDTNVQVNVYVNGELVGETPLQRYLLKPGPVRIRLVSDAYALERQLDLVVHEGDNIVKHEDFAVGKVVLNTEPPQEAEVLMGKARLGKLPGPPMTIGEGEHELLVRSTPPGFAGKVKVSIQKGRTSTYSVRMSKSDAD